MPKFLECFIVSLAVLLVSAGNAGRLQTYHNRPAIKTLHLQSKCTLRPAGDEERVADSPCTVTVLAGKPGARKSTVAAAGAYTLQQTFVKDVPLQLTAFCCQQVKKGLQTLLTL